MRSIAFLIVMSMLSVIQLVAQSPVRYSISFANRAHHEAEITVSFTNLDDRPLQLRMSRSSPGRYALHEFAKNVYNFRATGEGGRAVTVSRPDNHQWDVARHGGAVSVTYTLYGDHADGTYAGIDRTHAHLNMPATFMWARDTEARPIELVVQVPEGSAWRVATQLARTDDPFRFEAPDLQRFPCLGLARNAMRAGGTATAVLNAANEEAVAAFLAGRLDFMGIPAVVELTLEKQASPACTDVDAVMEIDRQAREMACRLIKEREC